MKPTHAYIEAHEGFFSTTYVLRSSEGVELRRFDSQDDAEDALRELLHKHEGGGLFSWFF